MNTMDATYRPIPARSALRGQQSDSRNSYLRVGIAATLLYFLLIPQQYNLTIGSFYLSPYRIFLLGATIYLLTSALRQSLRFVWPDFLIVLSIAWIALASYMTSGQLSTAVVQGGSHLVDMGLAYFLARATIQSPNDLRRFLILVAPGIAFTGVVVFAEALTHQLIVQSIASAMTGVPPSPFIDTRLGFMRGMASFPHPILAGIFLASFLPLYLLAGLRGWPRFLGLIGTGLGAFTMSSAAMLGLVVGFVLTCYDWLTERIVNVSWQLFLAFASALYLVIEASSNTGFYGLLVRYASFNTASGANRLLIWKYGTQNIAQHPWFGIGYADWDRPDWMHSDSFDWFWLILALRFGIPATVFVLGATLLAITVLAWKSREFIPTDARLLRGLAVSIAVFTLGLNSVSLWLTTLAWFFMLLGFTVSLGYASRPITLRSPVRPGVARRAYEPKHAPATG